MSAISDFLNQYGLLAIFVILFLKGLGIPIPVPGDFLMLLAGVRAAQRVDSLLVVILVLMAATVLASAAQYWLARGPSRALIYRVGRYVGLTPARLDKAAAAVRKRGPT